MGVNFNIMNKYILQQTEKPQHWVITDQDNLISIIFKEKQFNETQEVKLLDENITKSPTELAKILRQIGDYLVENHSELI